MATASQSITDMFPGRSIRSIAWSPTGHWIATGSGDRTLRVWNPDRALVKNSTELRGHTGPIERVAWNPTKEAELTSCSADGTVRFWDIRSKNCKAEVKLGGEGFTVTWSPDGKTVLAGRKVVMPSFNTEILRTLTISFRAG